MNKAFWPSGREVPENELTPEQWVSIDRVVQRHDISRPVEIIPGFNYVGVMAGDMFIGIEKDGHIHT